MPDTRPNVLWIYGEDLGPHLGCYGQQSVPTPHLDRLAAEGTTYTRHFATAPVCSASRSAMITGRYQTSFGAHHHRSCRDQPPPAGVRLLTDHFRDAGYFTCNSVGPDNFDGPAKTDFNFRREDPFDGFDWTGRRSGQPFYAQINLPDTHRMHRYGFATEPSPPDPGRIELPPEYPDHPLARRDWALYLKSVGRIDLKVGTILKRLDDEGLSENTIVAFISDHGPGHVRHKQFLYDGGIQVPLIVRWPGRFEAGARCDGLVSGIDLAPSSLAWCGLPVPEGMEGKAVLAGAEPRDHVIACRDRCDEADDRIRAVRTEQWKYIRNFMPERAWSQFSSYKEAFYPVLSLMRLLHRGGQLSPEQARFLQPERPPEELYDLHADPHELHNLAADPAHHATLEDMRQRLDRWIEQSGDQGQRPEPASQRAQIDKNMWAKYAEWLLERVLPPHADDETRLLFWDRLYARRGGWSPLWPEGRYTGMAP